jgi:hypothetical protein
MGSPPGFLGILGASRGTIFSAVSALQRLRNLNVKPDHRTVKKQKAVQFAEAAPNLENLPLDWSRVPAKGNDATLRF